MRSEPTLLERVTLHAASHGLNLAGVVPARTFDDCQPKGRRADELLPGCGTILVIASGGRDFWDKAAARCDGAEPDLDHHADRTLAELVAILDAHGHRSRIVHPERAPWLNFVQLGEMAGIGTVSPVVHMLIHPEYGLWVRCRAAILVAGDPFEGRRTRKVPQSFQPCLECGKPCLHACPVKVYDEAAPAKVDKCAEHRHRGGCERGCDARRACPVGREGYCKEEETVRHARCLSVMRRYFGLGAWRLVPRVLRRR